MVCTLANGGSPGDDPHPQTRRLFPRKTAVCYTRSLLRHSSPEEYPNEELWDDGEFERYNEEKEGRDPSSSPVNAGPNVLLRHPAGLRSRTPPRSFASLPHRRRTNPGNQSSTALQCLLRNSEDVVEFKDHFSKRVATGASDPNPHRWGVNVFNYQLPSPRSKCELVPVDHLDATRVPTTVEERPRRHWEGRGRLEDHPESTLVPKKSETGDDGVPWPRIRHFPQTSIDGPIIQGHGQMWNIDYTAYGGGPSKPARSGKKRDNNSYTSHIVGTCLPVPGGTPRTSRKRFIERR